MFYNLATGISAQELTNNVNKFLRDGWSLYGEPHIAVANHGSAVGKTYIQAVTKNKEVLPTKE